MYKLLFLLINLLYFSTCFDHCCAHHQEVKLYYTASGIITLCRWPSYRKANYVVGQLSSRTRHRVLAVAALNKSLSMVRWRWHISVSQLFCYWSMAVSFWVASIIVCVCFGVPPRECRGRPVHICTGRPPTECDDNRCFTIRFDLLMMSTTVIETCREI